MSLKQTLLLFCCREKEENARITIEYNDIERVSYSKYLGVMIEEKLT